MYNVSFVSVPGVFVYVFRERHMYSGYNECYSITMDTDCN